VFHFQELWGALTQGLNWMLAVGLLALGWLCGRFQAVAGRRTEAAIERRWILVDRRRKERAKEKAQGKARKAEEARIASVQRDRVGKRFLRRRFKGDVGMVGEVVELDRRDMFQRVIMTWSNPEGRAPHEDDDNVGQRISIAWKDLALSAEAQRHRTARLDLKSDKDDDGWVEFEMLV